MTRIAIMQPTYLPWIGYFDLMASVDVFVLLDSVQFSYQSWQHRNRIRTPAGLRWITVPVHREGRLGKRIADIELGASPDFPPGHISQLELHYGQTAHAPLLLPGLFDLLRAGRDGGRLIDVTVPAVRYLAERLDITTPILMSSELAASGQRSDLLVSLCRAVDAGEYISPPGSVAYLREDTAVWQAADVDILVHEYAHPEYRQAYEPFVPYASVVDLLCNLGPESRAVLDRGHRDPVPIGEVDA